MGDFIENSNPYDLINEELDVSSQSPECVDPVASVVQPPDESEHQELINETENTEPFTFDEPEDEETVKLRI